MIQLHHLTSMAREARNDAALMYHDAVWLTQETDSSTPEYAGAVQLYLICLAYREALARLIDQLEQTSCA